jgi:hypothetical protein
MRRRDIGSRRSIAAATSHLLHLQPLSSSSSSSGHREGFEYTATESTRVPESVTLYYLCATLPHPQHAAAETLGTRTKRPRKRPVSHAKPCMRPEMSKSEKVSSACHMLACGMRHKPAAFAHACALCYVACGTNVACGRLRAAAFAHAC